MNKEINDHINKNYEKYLKIIKAGKIFQSSKVKDSVNDILNDVLIEILNKDENLLLQKLKTESTYKTKNGLNTHFDSLIIHVVNLNLYSKTSRYLKNYIFYDKEVNENNFNILNLFDNEDLKIKEKVEELVKYVENIDIEYPYKKELFKQRWSLDQGKVEIVPYQKIANKYNIPLTSMRLIILEIEELLINIIKNNKKIMNYNEELKKWRTENNVTNYQEALKAFSPIWASLKKGEMPNTTPVKTKEQLNKENAVEFYNTKIRGRTIILPETLKELYFHLSNFGINTKLENEDCPSCISRLIKNLKINIGI